MLQVSNVARMMLLNLHCTLRECINNSDDLLDLNWTYWSDKINAPFVNPFELQGGRLK